MKKLTNKEIWKLLIVTWFELAFTGFVVYMASSPVSWYALGFAALIFMHGVLNYSKQSEKIDSRIRSIVPAVFLPSAFFALFGALLYVLFNSVSAFCPVCLGLYACTVGYGICAYFESYYA